MILAIPVLAALTIPELEPMVATAVTLLVHVPPAGEDASEAVARGQSVDGPLIGLGAGLMVIVSYPVMVAEQPVAGLVAVTE